MPKIEYTVDARGSIILPEGAPFDGKPVLVKLAAGWCEAFWDEGRMVQHSEGAEAEGFQWVCLDDQFTAELDTVSWWLPLPEYAYVKLVNRKKAGTAGGKARAEKLSPERRSEIAKSAASARWAKAGET